jgi:hypothetical protein
MKAKERQTVAACLSFISKSKSFLALMRSPLREEDGIINQGRID